MGISVEDVQESEASERVRKKKRIRTIGNNKWQRKRERNGGKKKLENEKQAEF